MLDRKISLEVKDISKSRNSAEISQSSNQILDLGLHQVLDEKDKEIVRLTKTIKKLKKQLKEKEEIIKVPVKFDGNNAYFKILLEKEVNRYNQLKDVLIDVTERIKKLSHEINSEFSIFQSNASMENLVNLLEKSNFSDSRESRSISMSESEECEESVHAEQIVDEFQIVVRGLMMKHGQIHKMNKQNTINNQHLQEELKSLQKEVKSQKKSKDLLQSLLEKSETEKNQLINQINSIASKQEIDELRAKSKQEIIMRYFKLHYRINDLEKEKEELLKSSNRDKQKQVKLYQVLLSQVRNMKDKQRTMKSMA